MGAAIHTQSMSRVPSRQSRRVLGLFACLALSLPVFATDSSDAHMTQQSVGALYHRSAFVHGYMHGYEEGFHWGNLDFQTGRQQPRSKESRASKSSYDKSFGTKATFRSGYHRGFLAGYCDGGHGREFRAHDMAKQAARDLPTAEDSKHLAVFDKGVNDGYDLGAVRGQNASRDDNDFDSTTDLCAPGSKELRSHAPIYCDGFRRGYTIGYSDGYLGTEVKPLHESTTAQK
jgi:hypothetical protein